MVGLGRPGRLAPEVWLGLLAPSLVVAALVFRAPAALAGPAIQTEIEEELTCQCGCGLTVHRCNHVNCPSAIPLRGEIAGLIEKGLSQEEILEYFRKKFGEKILSSPTTTGFNLAAWVAPFLAVLVAGGFIIRVASRWRQREQGQQAEAASAEAPPDHLRARLKDELDRFET